jgi:hypothetical protein
MEMESRACQGVKPVREPDARNGHVRFASGHVLDRNARLQKQRRGGVANVNAQSRDSGGATSASRSPVTHWWEYFRGGQPNQAFIEVRQLPGWLAERTRPARALLRGAGQPVRERFPVVVRYM